MSIIYQGNITRIEIRNHWQKEEQGEKFGDRTRLNCLEINSLAFDVIHVLTDQNLVVLKRKIEERLNQKIEEFSK